MLNIMQPYLGSQDYLNRLLVLKAVIATSHNLRYNLGFYSNINARYTLNIRPRN